MYNCQHSFVLICYPVLFRNRRFVPDVFQSISEAKPKQSQQPKKKNNKRNKPKHRQKRQTPVEELSYTTTEDIGKYRNLYSYYPTTIMVLKLQMIIVMYSMHYFRNCNSVSQT